MLKRMALCLFVPGILTYFGCESSSSVRDNTQTQDSDPASANETDPETSTSDGNNSETSSDVNDTGNSSTEEVEVDITDRIANITKECTTVPDKLSNGTAGWNSRYWDCCKPHCSWPENVDPDTLTPEGLAKNCSIENVEMECYVDSPDNSEYWQGIVGTTSGCDADGEAYTCYSQAPFAVCEDLAYGFAAVPNDGSDVCGKCYQLDFDGGNHEGNIKDSHKALDGKTMIVMASNVGGDVSSGQFDIMIPGGGVGIYTAGCAAQWGVDNTDVSTVGAQYGGFLTTCQTTEGIGYDDIDSLKTCVRKMCDNLFNVSGREDLLAGCYWFVDWMHVADNPTFTYQEVECPDILEEMYLSSF